MKLKSFEHKNDYVFVLEFANQQSCEVDLSSLLKLYVDLSSLLKLYVDLSEINSAQIDPEWGCLMFKGGMVDIEPKTLYAFAYGQNQNGLNADIDESFSLA